MAATVYPTDAQILQFLIDAKVLAVGSTMPTSLTDIYKAAWQSWESDTGYLPFYVAADAALTTRYFDAPVDYWLDLQGGLISEPTVVVGGATMVKDATYYLEPANYASLGCPIEAIKFSWFVTGLPRCISVNGRWGYTSDLPMDVFQAILRKGASLCHTAVTRGGVIAETEGDVSYRYSEGTSQLSTWNEEYRKVVLKFQKASL